MACLSSKASFCPEHAAPPSLRQIGSRASATAADHISQSDSHLTRPVRTSRRECPVTTVSQLLVGTKLQRLTLLERILGSPRPPDRDRPTQIKVQYAITQILKIHPGFCDFELLGKMFWPSHVVDPLICSLGERIPGRSARVCPPARASPYHRKKR